MRNIISVSRYLTSFDFYGRLLKQADHLRRYHRSDNPIIFDFSETNKIEPLVVPNLLCLGKVIMGESGSKAVLRIPETLRAGRLKFYMDQVGFSDLAYNKIFAFENSPYNGMEGKAIDPLCGSLQFSKELSRDEIINEILGYVAPFSREYLDEFVEYLEGEDYVNKVDHFLYEIADNCRIHGESDSFLTIHARYSDRRVYVAVSDTGKGFLESWNNREKSDEDKGTEGFVLKDAAPADEKESILCGVYKRKDSRIYGLYNIIRQTLELNGTLRVHSNNTQIVFTPRMLESLKAGHLLNDETFLKWNVRQTAEFEGTHIEMEIPF